MGRRRVENVCASLLLSCRAARPSHPFRRAYSSKGLKFPPNEPLAEGFRTVELREGEGESTIYVPGLADHRPPPKKKAGHNAAPHVAVLGGGLTGLTTAFYLARKLPPASKIVVYEASSRWGGWIKSERATTTRGGTRHEVLFERGPRLISLSQTQGRLDKLVFVDIMETLGLLPVAVPPRLSRYIWDAGQLRALNNLFDNLAHPNFWKILKEMILSGRIWNQLNLIARNLDHVLPEGLVQWVRRRSPPPVINKDTSVGEMIHRYLGSQTMVDVHLSALLHGIWGGSVHKLSAVSALGSAYDAVQMLRNRDMTDHQLRHAPDGSFYYPKKEYQFFQRFFSDLREEGRTEGFLDLWSKTPNAMAHVGPHGLESLPLGLANMLESAPNVELRLGCGVEGVHHQNQSGKVEVVDKTGKSEKYDKVISTLPADNLARVAKNPLQLSEFSAVTMMTVNIWYPLGGRLVPKGVGYLIPASTPFEENPERALGVFFDSSAGVGESVDTSPKGEVNSNPNSSDTQVKQRREYGTKLFVLMGGHLYDRDGVEPPTQEEAIEQAKSLLERHLGIPSEVPCDATANLVKDCLPQHNVGHHSRLTTLHDDLVKNYGKRLAVVGGSFTKPGVAGAMRAGYDIADTIANDDFMATGLENHRAPEAFAGTPHTIIDGSKDNDLFKAIIQNRKDEETLESLKTEGRPE